MNYFVFDEIGLGCGATHLCLSWAAPPPSAAVLLPSAEVSVKKKKKASIAPRKSIYPEVSASSLLMRNIISGM